MENYEVGGQGEGTTEEESFPILDSSGRQVAEAHDEATAQLFAGAPGLGKGLLLALAQLPLPNHSGSLDPEAAKQGRGVAEPLATNSCTCPLHTAHREARKALKDAGLGQI